MDIFKSFKPRKYLKGKKLSLCENPNVRWDIHLFKEICANCGKCYGDHYWNNCTPQNAPNFVG